MPLSSHTPEAPAELTKLVGHLLRRAQQMHAGLWNEQGPTDLTSPQFAVLQDLGKHPWSSQIELGERIGIDRSTLAEMVGRMVERDLLDRKQDPADGRRKVLAVTTSGSALLLAGSPSVIAVNEQLVAELTKSEHRELMRLLTKVLSSA